MSARGSLFTGIYAVVRRQKVPLQAFFGEIILVLEVRLATVTEGLQQEGDGDLRGLLRAG